MNQESLFYDYIGDISDGEAALRNISDVELVEQIAHHQESAFAELYRRYSYALFNFLHRLVNEPSAAEDLLQEVFLAVWSGAGRYRQMASVKTWMFNIAYKQGISWLRKRREMTEEDLDYLPAGEDPEQTSLHRYDRELLLQAFQQLSTVHRSVVELVLYFEMPYAEVAQILECPVGTVKSRLSYARKHMAAWIDLHGQRT